MDVAILFALILLNGGFAMSEIVQVVAFKKRSSTFSSTARRTRPEARNSGRWRLTHCHSGLARGLRGR